MLVFQKINIILVLQLILQQWEDQLQSRSKEEKADTKGKLMGATYTQTQEYLKPLLRKLKSFTLPEDISDSLTEIVVHLLNRNYLKVSSEIIWQYFLLHRVIPKICIIREKYSEWFIASTFN